MMAGQEVNMETGGRDGTYETYETYGVKTVLMDSGCLDEKLRL
jgi:hypothetical protein